MSDAFQPTPNSSSPAAADWAPSRAIRALVRGIAYLGVAAAIWWVAFNTYRIVQDRAVMRESIDHLTELRGLVQPVQKHLAPEYTDKQNRLLADPPSDPKDLLDPDTLVLAHYVDGDVDKQLVDWDALQAALELETGKKIVRQEYQNSIDDVAAIKAGSIQIVALHAADAPYIVNNAGFIPIAVLGSEAGHANGNRLDIAVPTDSKIRALADIRLRKLTCTEPNSMTGYRAAIIVLAQQAGLRLDEDYSINFSLGQKRSVQGLIGGDYSVAALSDDKIQSMLKKGSIKTTDYRVIYQSEVIPRLTIGYVYNLEPTLAEKVTAAAVNFKNEEGGSEESTGEPMRFFPIDYKKDFEFVRTVDNSFDPRFYKAIKAKSKPE
ncbi:MAG TPA: PhnD/SsuA/transferrin family substrate-binding protein [Pirellulales bacterium]|jgi:phosphonate transport system substrate-binding protein|nr:PhnD/SsuA/transferrin family substrate-binding protein [Pirellulales bacterium]